MTQFVSYKILCAPSPQKLEDLVELHMEKGYTPTGGPLLASPSFAFLRPMWSQAVWLRQELHLVDAG